MNILFSCLLSPSLASQKIDIPKLGLGMRKVLRHSLARRGKPAEGGQGEVIQLQLTLHYSIKMGKPIEEVCHKTSIQRFGWM